MQMFEIKSFEVCPQTGITTFDMRWNLGHGERSDRGSFINRQDAERYILSSKRSYILLMFSKFVSHARVLFETGHKDFYKTETKVAALDRCQKYNQWLADKKLPEICKVILALEEDMRKILPSPNNPSYDASEGKLLDMIVFSKKELNLYPKNQPNKIESSK